MELPPVPGKYTGVTTFQTMTEVKGYASKRSGPRVQRSSFHYSDLWEAPLHDFPIRDEILLSYSPLCPEMEVLEVGPGSGFTAFWLARQVRRLTLLDVAEETLVELRDRLRKLANLDFVRGDLSQPGLANVLLRRFDTILGLDVFEYVMNPAYCLENLYSVLRPGGCLFLTFPNTPPPEGDGVNWFTDARELEALLRNARFRKWEIFAAGVRPYARRVYTLGHEWPLRIYRRLRKGNPNCRPQTYESTWAFQNRKCWARYRWVAHLWWIALDRIMRMGGPIFEIDESRRSLVGRQLIVRAWR
jgi:SAM-dependent methyltransferase